MTKREREQGAALQLLEDLLWCLDEIKAGTMKATREQLDTLRTMLKTVQALAIANM